jgi:hypothetical protein
MDFKETKSEDKWLQSLVLLFQACEPLTHDSLLTKEEFAERQRNIERHTFYEDRGKKTYSGP